MLITDNNIIEKAVPKFPELMAENSEAKLLLEFEKLKNLRDTLSKARLMVRDLEERYTNQKSSFEEMSKMFEITFGKKDIIKYIPSDNTRTGDIINRARAKH